MALGSALSAVVSAFKAGATPDQAAAAAGTQTTAASNAARQEESQEAPTEDVDASAISAEDLEDAEDSETADEGTVRAGEGADDGEDADEQEASASPKNADVEDVSVTDERGKRSVRVDFSDRDAIRQAVRQAAGMRKYQSERDAARRELASLKEGQPDLQKDAEDFRKLSKAWDEKGLDGLLGVLSGGKQTIESLVEERIKHREWASKASPAELDAFNAREAAKTAEAAAEKARREFEGYKTDLEKKQTEADRSVVEAYTKRGFAEHRFAGKLGDASLEHQLDELLWAGTREALMQLPDDAEFTAEAVGAEFARRAAVLKRAVKQETDKQVRGVMKQKKIEAKEKVQTQVREAASKPTSREAAFREGMRKGDMVSAVANFLRR